MRMSLLSPKRKSISPKTINLTMTVVSNFMIISIGVKLDVNFYDFMHMESKYSKNIKVSCIT